MDSTQTGGSAFAASVTLYGFFELSVYMHCHYVGIVATATFYRVACVCCVCWCHWARWRHAEHMLWRQSIWRHVEL